MGLLDSNFEQRLEGDIMLGRLLHDTDLSNGCTPYIGVTYFQPRSRYNPVRLNDIERPPYDELSIVRGCFNCPDRTVIAGNIDWTKYGVTEINCIGKIGFIHGDGIPNVSKITAAQQISIQHNFRNHGCKEFSAPQIAFMGLVCGSAATEHCTFNCEELKFNDLPKSFAGIKGHINTLRISLMEFKDFEDIYGNPVIPQTVGSINKKIVHLAGVRAFYNNPKKYNRYWIHPNELIDADKLIANMGLSNVLEEYLYLSDCNFEMVFHKRNGRWYCTECAKK